MGKEDDPEVKVRILLRDKEKALAKKDFKEAAKCCNYIGIIYSEQGKYEESLKAHNEELKLCQKANDRLGTAVANRMVGESLALFGWLLP